jgi:tRNA-specific 2-thiouridylase
MGQANLPKVLVAMSGGVDSSVAAALLVEQGYPVIGLMLRLWQMEGEDCENRCCTPDAMTLARQTAAQLNIPFYVIDSREAFKNTVVQSFIESCAQGLTPNPCFICNQQFRWGTLLDHADALGAKYIATGHYARLQSSDQRLVSLFCGSNISKDQSYVLSGLNQAQLSRTLLPIGNFCKSEVRQIAARFNLPVASRPDSQDLCFIGGADYRQFLAQYAPQMLTPGLITNRQGELLGRHNGLARYTIGQRKGLGISSQQPYYVLDKDTSRNNLVVGKAEELGKVEMTVQKVNWISGEPPAFQFKAQIKIRYKSAPAPALVSFQGHDQVRVQFEHSLRDITPGQIAVFYLDDLCLGSGTIISNMINPKRGSL